MKCYVLIFFTLLFIVTTANAENWDGVISGNTVACTVDKISVGFIFGEWESFRVTYGIMYNNVQPISYRCSDTSSIFRFPGSLTTFSCSTQLFSGDPNTNWSGQNTVYIDLQPGTQNAKAKICQDFHLKAQLKHSGH